MCIIVLHLFLTYIVIKIASRGLYKVIASTLIDALGHDGRIEHYGAQFVQFVADPCAVGNGCHDDAAKVFFAEIGYELLASIVMIDAIGKPHTLQIIDNGTKLVRLTIARVALIDSLKQEAYA